ncbi:NAD(P)-dependent alcohol dehydrogenase [Agrococcus casei]|uniref:NAD(P)-dependent alcohol dehydrogenase n=1 Tax=Agrococcus casei TaxID=343512 RepID=UPI003F906ED1
MSNVPAYIATSVDAPLEAGTVWRRDVGPNDVLIDIRWSGICHSDIHTVRGDWGPTVYPLVVGHEIAGTVAAVGSAVTKHAVGDRVGVGCLVNSCRECANCVAGAEQYCLNGKTGTYAEVDRDGTITQGGYATQVVVDADFVLRVPESIPFEKAAPLLCAGITTYSPLRRWNAGPGTRVAVVGLGGLGHMAVKLAHAMGAEVTVLSRTLSKRDDGLQLGADHYFATSDEATFTDLAGSFDLILNTISQNLALDQYLELLALDGTLVTLAASAEPITISEFALQGQRRSLSASTIGGIPETQEMLDFCAEHGIAPEVEIVAADQINEAWDRVLASDVRFRFVIDIETLPALVG